MAEITAMLDDLSRSTSPPSVHPVFGDEIRASLYLVVRSQLLSEG